MRWQRKMTDSLNLSKSDSAINCSLNQSSSGTSKTPMKPINSSVLGEHGCRNVNVSLKTPGKTPLKTSKTPSKLIHIDGSFVPSVIIVNVKSKFGHTVRVIVRAARCVIMQTRPLCFAAVSFLYSFIQCKISTVSRPIAAKLCHMIRNGCNFKNQIQNLGSSGQKICGPKTCFFRREFGQLRTSITNISRTEQDIDNRKNGIANYNLSRICLLTHLANFGPQTAKMGPSLWLPSSYDIKVLRQR